MGRTPEPAFGLDIRPGPPLVGDAPENDSEEREGRSDDHPHHFGGVQVPMTIDRAGTPGLVEIRVVLVDHDRVRGRCAGDPGGAGDGGPPMKATRGSELRADVLLVGDTFAEPGRDPMTIRSAILRGDAVLIVGVWRVPSTAWRSSGSVIVLTRRGRAGRGGAGIVGSGSKARRPEWIWPPPAPRGAAGRWPPLARSPLATSLCLRVRLSGLQERPGVGPTTVAGGLSPGLVLPDRIINPACGRPIRRGVSMERCAILVDAGYLLGAAGTLVAGDADRAALEVDHALLVQALIHEAEAQTGLPVLRLLWYDGAFNSQPSPEHRALRVLPDVKLRLGELVVRSGRIQQKGVDSYLQRDLTTLARNKAVADVVLLGGDEDLRRALEEAQDYGTRVHLWGVEAAAPEYNQSQSLIAEADRRWVIPADWIQQYVRLRATDAERDVAKQESGAPDGGGPAALEENDVDTSLDIGAASDEAPETRPTASPEDLSRLVATFDKRNSVPRVEESRGWTVTEATHDEIPRLRDITTSAQAWRDNEEDATMPGRTPADVGKVFGARWASRAPPEQLDALLGLRPRAPRRLDGELLRYAESLGIDTWEDEAAKIAVRSAFWRAVQEEKPQES